MLIKFLTTINGEWLCKDFQLPTSAEKILSDQLCSTLVLFNSVVNACFEYAEKISYLSFP